MPIRLQKDDESKVLLTLLEGEIDDEQLIAHYRTVTDEKLYLRYKREIVDGREATKIAVTPEGQARLAALLSGHKTGLAGYRAAMIATSDLVYGMFRMWEMSRGMLGYELKVFRDEDAARYWLFDD